MKEIHDCYSFKNLYSKFIKHKKCLLILLVLIILIGIVLNSISPYVYGEAIDNIIKLDISKVRTLLIVSVIINILGEVLGAIEQKIAISIITEISNRISVYMLDKCIKSKLSSIQAYSIGELLNRINNTGGEIISFYLEFVSNIVTVVVNIIISIYFMVKISKLLLIIAILFAPTTYIVNLMFHNKIKKNRKQSIEIMDSCMQFSDEIISNISGIKLCGLEETSVGKFSSILNKSLGVTKEGINITLILQVMQEVVGITFGIIIVYISAIMIKNGTMTIGSLVSFNVYLDRLFTSIRKLLVLNVSAKGVEINTERFKEIDCLPIESNEMYEDILDNEILKEQISSISVKNLNFAYIGNDKVLENLNFEIDKVGLYLFVGENGCGKSSVLKLLSKLYDNYEGIIEINNFEISNIPLTELRKKVFFVEKKNFIITDSVLKNIYLKDMPIDRKEVNDICREVGIHEFIVNLEKGYDAVIGKDVLDMSSGQLQRLILARTLLNKKAELLLLDEITSDLDVKSEEEIIKILKELSKSKIIIMITHRLHTATMCDKIFYFEDGKISDVGTHYELMESNKNYSGLYHTCR